MVYWILSTFMVALTCALALSTDLRTYITDDLLHRNQRKILSVISTTNSNTAFKILKIKKGKNLYVEVYSDDKKEQFDLGATNNGTVFLNGKSTEMASVDIDNDGLREIIIPTLNSRSKSELYILKYNSKTQRFLMSNSVPYLNLNN